MSNAQKRSNSPDATATPEALPKIMTKPLPEILDELESYIRRVEEAVGVAQQAARESKGAAAQARESGEKAADSARQAAETAVAAVRDEASKTTEALILRVSDLEKEIMQLKEKINRESKAIDQAFLALKDTYTGESPWLNNGN
jgi:DNA-binding NtrC family response regulator